MGQEHVRHIPKLDEVVHALESPQHFPFARDFVVQKPVLANKQKAGKRCLASEPLQFRKGGF